MPPLPRNPLGPSPFPPRRGARARSLGGLGRPARPPEGGRRGGPRLWRAARQGPGWGAHGRRGAGAGHGRRRQGRQPEARRPPEAGAHDNPRRWPRRGRGMAAHARTRRRRSGGPVGAARAAPTGGTARRQAERPRGPTALGRRNTGPERAAAPAVFARATGTPGAKPGATPGTPPAWAQRAGAGTRGAGWGPHSLDVLTHFVGQNRGQGAPLVGAGPGPFRCLPVSKRFGRGGPMASPSTGSSRERKGQPDIPQWPAPSPLS